MISLAKILNSLSDTDLFQKVQGMFWGKSMPLKALNVYGICFNPPDNSFGMAFSANGYDNETFVIIDHPQKRFKNLAKGELMVGNFLTGSYVHFKADGSVLVKVNDACSMLMNPSGVIDIVSTNINVTGTVTASDFITSVAHFNEHIHPGDSGGVTGTPQ